VFLLRPTMLLTAWLTACAGVSLADGGGMGRQHNPWGRFDPGAWKLVRVSTESFDPSGSTLSVTETKTILEQVSRDSLTLQIQVAMELGEKILDTRPQSVRQGFDGELPVAGAVTRQLGTEVVTIQDRRIECKVQEVSVKDANSRTVTKTYYCDQVEPYVMRRHSLKTDSSGKTVLAETNVEVTALDVPCKVLRESQTAAHVRAEYKSPRGSTVTVAVTSMAVPGGVVCQTLKELDSQGRLVRRSSLELLDYGVNSDDDHSPSGRHRRPGRSRKGGRNWDPGTAREMLDRRNSGWHIPETNEGHGESERTAAKPQTVPTDESDYL
jgi:hypothetical protein